METDKGRVTDQHVLDVVTDAYTHTTHIMLSVIIMFSALLLAAIGVIVWQVEKRVETEREYESYEYYEYDVDQDAEDHGENIFVGRDYYGDKTACPLESDEGQNP